MADLTPIEKKQRELRENEKAYILAKEYVNSEIWPQERMQALEKIKDLVIMEGYKSDGEAHYLLGRIRQILEDLDSPLQIITNYERLKKSVEDEVARSKR